MTTVGTDQVTTVHMCPPEGSGLMPCCGRTPFEVLTDRMTLDPELVTCGRALVVGYQWFADGDVFEVPEGQLRRVHFDRCTSRPKRKCQSQYHHWGRGDHVVPFDADWVPA